MTAAGMLASGTPEEVVAEPRSYTGQFLKELLERRPKTGKRRSRAEGPTRLRWPLETAFLYGRQNFAINVAALGELR